MPAYESLGLKPIVNASGPVTRLGGAPMPAEVLEAFHQAAEQSVPLEQLQAAASRIIAEATGAEAGLVTAGSAAALTLGAAAIMAGHDAARMEALPRADDFPHEFVVARQHRSGYDHAVRAAGARLIEVGFDEVSAGAGVRRTEAWEYEVAFNARTAGVLYTLAPHARPPLKAVVEIAHRHNLPVLVDAAGELPPRSNLRLAASAGADLVGFSGGKALAGPQSTGILCGRRELIASAALQMLDMDDHWDLWTPPPDFIDKQRLAGMPRHGIGRALKVSKEEIVALLTAMRLFREADLSEAADNHRQLLRRIAFALEPGGIAHELIEPVNQEQTPVLEVVASGAADAMEVCRRLRNGCPPIYVGHGKLDAGKLVINPSCLRDREVEVLARRLLEELGHGALRAC